MLLPQMWLRKRKLETLLKDYPLYDPPHKVEERVLPKEQAQQNFEYFMDVREQRAVYFTKSLKNQFDIEIAATPRGVEALDLWMFQYGGLLLPNEMVEVSYFTYDPPWRGTAVGCNALFDTGIVFGEFLIANCPKLRWEMDPISALRPNAARVLKRELGSGFQRPELTGFQNPHWRACPLHELWTFAHQLAAITTISGLWNYRSAVGDRNTENLRHCLALIFTTKIREYQAGDPTKLYGSTGNPADTEKDDD